MRLAGRGGLLPQCSVGEWVGERPSVRPQKNRRACGAPKKSRLATLAGSQFVTFQNGVLRLAVRNVQPFVAAQYRIHPRHIDRT